MSLVSDISSKLNLLKANGCDRIPVILKKCASVLAPVLPKLHRKYLAASYFPAYWKSSSGVLVFKNSEEQSDPSNYCPICLLPLFRKVLKAPINAKLVKHLTWHDLLSDKEYGFQFARYTANLLTAITKFVYEALDQTDGPQAVRTDILKVFNRFDKVSWDEY